MNKEIHEKRIETEIEVQTYIDRLKFALSGKRATVNFQHDRRVDENRGKRYTNRYTILKLFSDDDVIDVLKRELNTITVKDYIETLKDIKFSNKSEMRVFGKKYSNDYVYIKIRVELLNAGNDYVFIMSFHFAENEFKNSDFPYRENKGVLK